MKSSRHRSVGHQLRALYQDVPASLLQSVEPRRRLTPEESAENFRFVNDDTQDEAYEPAELMHRVRRGVKPMATFLLKKQKQCYLSARSVRGATRAFGLEYRLFYLRGGWQEAVVFQTGAKLADFYDPCEVIARYREVGLELDPALFEAPLDSLARPLLFDDIVSHLRLPVKGLCLGYPIAETISLIARTRE
jgi:hypothetical protein